MDTKGQLYNNFFYSKKKKKEKVIPIIPQSSKKFLVVLFSKNEFSQIWEKYAARFMKILRYYILFFSISKSSRSQRRKILLCPCNYYFLPRKANSPLFCAIKEMVCHMKANSFHLCHSSWFNIWENTRVWYTKVDNEGFCRNILRKLWVIINAKDEKAITYISWKYVLWQHWCAVSLGQSWLGY